jgi:hypothetical protein
MIGTKEGTYRCSGAEKRTGWHPGRERQLGDANPKITIVYILQLRNSSPDDLVPLKARTYMEYKQFRRDRHTLGLMYNGRDCGHARP